MDLVKLLRIELAAVIQGVSKDNLSLSDQEAEYVYSIIFNNKLGLYTYELYDAVNKFIFSEDLLKEKYKFLNICITIDDYMRKHNQDEGTKLTSEYLRLLNFILIGFLRCGERVTDEEINVYYSVMSNYKNVCRQSDKNVLDDSYVTVNEELLFDEDYLESYLKTYVLKNNDDDAVEEQYVDESDYDKDTLAYLLNELNRLVGLNNVKNEVQSLINLLKIQEIRKMKGMKALPVSKHLVFLGNPGTGKTTVARLLAKIYKEIGVVSRGQFIETDRSGLVAEYIVHTAQKTKKVVESAIGGILFIDEAYSLIPEVKDNDFGQEAVDTLLKLMEDNREDLIVIVAGYTSLMNRFLNSNPGLSSRFSKYIEFPDYNSEELLEIFKMLCNQNDYKYTQKCIRQVHEYFTNICEKKTDNFANGRAVRNYFEAVIMNQANRIAYLDDFDEDQLVLLKYDDVKSLQ